MANGFNYDDSINTMKQLVDSNNRLSFIAADRANRFTEHLQDRAEQFNASEAEKNRAFQLDQRNTAHQAEVKDLIRAGLNPVLSANNGASVTSGATASVGSGSGIKADIDMQKASLYSAWKMNKVNNAQALKINKLNNANARRIAEIGAAASMYGANASAAASRYGALLAYQLGQDRITFDENHPNNIYQAIGELIDRTGLGSGLGLGVGSGSQGAKDTRENNPGNKKVGKGRN